MSTLHVQQHEPRSIEWWFEQVRADRLDLNPTFQRRSEIWSKYKRAHLIDSILNGFDIPKFYVADFTLGQSALNESRRPYAVVDGKQRFEAIFSFLRNEYPLNQSSVYDADASLIVKGLRFEELKREYPNLVSKILDFKPVVMSLATDDESKIYEMFVRLNSGEAANSAERRNAQPGPIPILVRELVNHVFFQKSISFSKKRMADHQLAAKLLMMEFKKGAVDTKANNMDRFVRQASDETTPIDYDDPTAEQEAALNRYIKAKDDVITVLERLAECFKHKDPLLSASNRIPVYYLVLRNHAELVDNFRDFIGEFEAKVIEAMRAARDKTGLADERLLNYYTLSRTGNDQHSVRGRYDALISELRQKRLLRNK